MSTTIIDKVVEELNSLPQDLQWRVLQFAHALAISTPRGTPGREILRFAGTIPADDLQRMQRAIEDGCEQVDVDEW